MPRVLFRALTAAGALTLGLAGAVVFAAPAAAANFNVTLPGDDGAVGTLRWAVNQANATAGPDSITIDAGLTVTLESQLAIVEGVTVTGGFGTTITHDDNFDMIAINPDALKPDQAYQFDNIRFEGDADGPLVGRAINALSGTPFTSLTTNNCSFDGFFASGSGGAINTLMASGNGPVNLSVTSFTNNGSLLGGGAVSVVGSTSFSLTGNGAGVGTVSGNTSSVGGGIVVDRTPTVTVEDMTFTSNRATTGNGGALWVRRAATLDVTDSTFGALGTGNTADASGGAIFAGDVSTTTLTGVTAIDNASGPNGGGGAVHIESGVNATIDGGLYEENSATASDGGAVRFYELSSLVTIEGGAVFKNNGANGAGGAVNIQNDETTPAVEIIDGASFVGNDAGTLGGAVFSTDIDTFTTQDAEYSHNGAGWSGGAIWQEDSFSTFLAERSLFDGNFALDGNGGAIGIEGMPEGDHSVTLRSSTFSGNSANSTTAYGGAFVIGETGDGTVISVDSSTFVDNSVTEDDGVAQGAAIAAIDSDSLNGRLDIVNSTIQETEEEDDPFAVFVQHVGETGLLTVRNTTLLGIGGVLVDDNDGGVELINSIIESTEGPGAELEDGSGNLFTAQYSLFTSAFDAGVILDEATNRFDVADMRLGPLQNNGGPTDTRLPADNSPAVNKGNAAIEVDLPTVDQRGVDGGNFPRVSGPAMDIGAVEIQVPLPATGSTIPLWIPIVGGAILLVGIAAIVFTVVSRRRLKALEAPAAATPTPTDPEVPPTA